MPGLRLSPSLPTGCVPEEFLVIDIWKLIAYVRNMCLMCLKRYDIEVIHLQFNQVGWVQTFKRNVNHAEIMCISRHVFFLSNDMTLAGLDMFLS